MGKVSTYRNDLPLGIEEEEVGRHLLCFSTYDPGLRGAGLGLVIDGIRLLLVAPRRYDTTLLDADGEGHCSARTESWAKATEIRDRYREAARPHPDESLGGEIADELRAIDRDVRWPRRRRRP